MTSSQSTGTFLITGASSGIGEALAWSCAKRGHDLIIAARSSDKLDQLAGEISAKHDVRVDAIAIDLSEDDSAARLYDAVSELGVQVDWFVNNAGFGTFGEFAATDLDTQISMIRLNVEALTNLSWRFLQPMLERGMGGILNVASTAAFQPGPLMAVYYSTKAYVLHFSEAIANEVSDRGVTVSCLCPGPTSTGFQEAAEMDMSIPLLKSAFLMSAEEVAESGYAGLMRGKRIIIPGILNSLAAFSTRFAPRALSAAFVRKAQES